MNSFCNLSYTSSSIGSDQPVELLLTFLARHWVTSLAHLRDPCPVQTSTATKELQIRSHLSSPIMISLLKSFYLPVFPADTVCAEGTYPGTHQLCFRSVRYPLFHVFPRPSSLQTKRKIYHHSNISLSQLITIHIK